jgi:hypothetical protein
MSEDSGIKNIEGADSLNALIDKFNGIIDEWDGIYSPIDTNKSASIKAAGLDKTPGANITHVFLGLILTFIADLNMSLDDVKKSIKFLDKEPYIQITAVDKYKALIDSMPNWISAYFEGMPLIENFIPKLEEIPTEAVNVFSEAPSEFAELEFM